MTTTPKSQYHYVAHFKPNKEYCNSGYNGNRVVVIS